MYIVIFGIILYFFVCEKIAEQNYDIFNLKNKNSINKTIFVLIVLMLFFISTFRAENIGADYPNYISNFRGVQVRGYGHFEKGFNLLNKIACIFGKEPYILSGLLNIIIFSALIIYICNYVEQKYWLLCIFIFIANPYLFIQGTFNIVRQTTALAVVIFAVFFLLKRKWIFFGVLLFTATTIHKSMAVMIFLPLIFYYKWNSGKFRILSVVCLVFNLLSLDYSVAKLFLNLFEFEGYIDKQDSFLNNKIYVIFIFLVIQFFLFYYDKLFENDFEKKFIDLYLFSLCFLLIAVSNNQVYRIYVSFTLLSLPAVPLICKSENKINYGFLIKWIYVGYYSVFYIGYVLRLTNNTAYIPFKFIFE